MSQSYRVCSLTDWGKVACLFYSWRVWTRASERGSTQRRNEEPAENHRHLHRPVFSDLSLTTAHWDSFTLLSWPSPQQNFRPPPTNFRPPPTRSQNEGRRRRSGRVRVCMFLARVTETWHSCLRPRPFQEVGVALVSDLSALMFTVAAKMLPMEIWTVCLWLELLSFRNGSFYFWVPVSRVKLWESLCQSEHKIWLKRKIKKILVDREWTSSTITGC